MILKTLLLPIIPLAVLTVDASAQGRTRTVTKTTVVESRASYNLYRPIPRAPADVNKTKARVAVFKPTQHYYTRDGVISYRYTVQAIYGGTVDTTSYLGPSGAVFFPDGEDLPPSAAVRNFASIQRRAQPGVGMIAPTTTTTTTIKKTSTSTATPASHTAGVNY